MPSAESRIARTARLHISRLKLEDAEFILRLLNEPLWLRFIGDKGVHSLEQARDYLRTGPLASYAEHGFGLYRVSLRQSGTGIGLCGVLKRPTLPDADLGFAFLQQWHGRGYAREAAEAVIEHARTQLGLKRLLAITTPDNLRSHKLLETVGFHQEGMIRLTEDGDELRLFSLALR